MVVTLSCRALAVDERNMNWNCSLLTVDFTSKRRMSSLSLSLSLLTWLLVILLWSKGLLWIVSWTWRIIDETIQPNVELGIRLCGLKASLNHASRITHHTWDPSGQSILKFRNAPVPWLFFFYAFWKPFKGPWMPTHSDVANCSCWE